MSETPWTSELRSQVVHGLGWKAFSQISVQAMAVVTTVFIAHLLTPSDVGLVAMATVFSALALIVSDLALGAALVQKETLTEADRSSAFWLSVGFGAVLTLVGLALAAPIARLYGEPEVEPLFQVISITFLLAALGTTQNALLIRDMRFRSLEVRTVLSSGLGGGMAILLALLGAGPWAIVGQKLTVNAASTILVWRASRWRPRVMASRTSLRHLVNFSRWIVGARLLSYVNGNADNYLIGRHVGSAALGSYSIAYNVMLVPLTRLVSPVQQVFYPVLSRIREPRRVGEVWLRSTRMVAFITMPAFAGMAVVAPDFVAVVLGDQWSDSIEVLQILCWVGIVQTVVWQTVTVLQALDRTAWIFRFAVISTIVTVTAFVIGVQWGIVGVAVASAIVSTAMAPFYLSMPLRLTGIGPIRFLGTIGGVVQASAIMAVALLALRHFALESLPPAISLAVLVAIGVALYVPLAAWRAPETLREIRRIRHRSRHKEAGALVS